MKIENPHILILSIGLAVALASAGICAVIVLLRGRSNEKP
jgi:hypothetical protein